MPTLDMATGLLFKQKFRTWMKILLHYVFDSTQVNQMTYEPMHSAQAQSVRATKKYILVLLVTSVATFQEVRMNVYLSLIPSHVLMF